LLQLAVLAIEAYSKGKVATSQLGRNLKLSIAGTLPHNT